MKTAKYLLLLLSGWLLLSLSVSCDSDDESVEMEEAVAPYIDNEPLPVGCDTLRVLALGNSFTLDAIAYLHEMVRASDIDLKRLVVYVGVHAGASLEYWNRELASEHTVYLARAAGDLTMQKRGTLKELLAQPWDIVCLQQNSAGAADYGTFNPHLRSLINGVRTYCPNPKVAFAWQMAWSCWKGYPKQPFLPDRYERICAAMKTQMERDGIDILIPIGTAIENARHSYLQTPHDLTRDGLHIAHGVGRYVAAATWFESILSPVFGTTVVGNPYLFQLGPNEELDSWYESASVTAVNRRDCQLFARRACEHPFGVTPSN